ncbi:MAG: DNA-binding transcriptional regulator Fis [Proteobacteria bacterium]|nr:DNA-binding transcriptional regulator Fis [Pseudomonadota bacterium]
MIKAKARKQTASDRGEAPEKCLAENVRHAMENYFEDLDGHQASNIYSLFLEEVEKPFFEVIMQYTQGNITRASQMLGLNRVTLRNRLKKYGIE